MPEATAAGRARQGLIVLTLINLFNYLDRFVVPSLLESIKKSELHPSDTQLFSLVPAFTVVYMLAAPVFGPLGDRRARPPLIALGVLIWSVATALGGFARSYATLFLARATVGVGEAAYGTIAPSLLADYYPRQYRGRVFSIFFAAIPVASALGIQLGGLVDAHFGWRRAFFIAGIPGLLPAALALTLRDPPRRAQAAAGRGAGSGIASSRARDRPICGCRASRPWSQPRSRYSRSPRPRRPSTGRASSPRSCCCSRPPV